MFVILRKKRLQDIHACVNGYRKMRKLGMAVFPEQPVLDCPQLGILTWLDIPDDEMKKLPESFKVIMQADKNRHAQHISLSAVAVYGCRDYGKRMVFSGILPQESVPVKPGSKIRV